LVKFCLIDKEGNVVDDTVSVPLEPGEQIAGHFFQDLDLTEFSCSMVLRAQGNGRFIAVALVEIQKLFTVVPVEGSTPPNIPN
jgi:hypothetical protein